MPEEEKPEPMFYVSRHRGFTAQVDMAAHDSKGIPIPAPGYVALQFRRLEAQRDREVNLNNRLKNQGMEQLLDNMEAYDALLADPANQGFGGTNSLGSTVMRAEMLGMAKILAIMNYGAEYKTDPEAAINRIRQSAAARFEE